MNRFQAERHGEGPLNPNTHATGISTGREEPITPYTAAEAERDISMFNTVHEWDPNIGTEKLDAINKAVEAHDGDAEIALEEELMENSPYPEVQAAVQATDDVTLPSSTFRAWFLGLLFVTIGSGLNVLFSLRDPSITVGSLVAQLCSYPCGVFMAKVLPKRTFKVFGYEFSLNPGPFNKKEHTLIVIMANVTFANGPGM
jgi:hypothetical protein